MLLSPYVPLFQISRGEAIESIHYGSIAVVASHGDLVAWYGKPDALTFMRSAAKPFQILPLLERGGQAKFQLTLREIALMCASHSGTDEHVAVLEAIQSKTIYRETNLLCGVHTPFHRATADAMRQRGEAPTSNRHNCSGKHTGMMAYAQMMDVPLRVDSLDYIDLEHPIQQDILRVFADMCCLSPKQIRMGIDGCSVPNFAVPLKDAALAFARLCDPSRLPADRAAACQTVTAAMTAHPDMVAGPHRFDTHLMKVTGGRIVCKGGAEGYQGLGVLPGALGPDSPALGIAFKISDGDLKGHNRPYGDPRGHARPPVTLEILRQLGVLSPGELEALAEYGPTFPVYNWRNLMVGQAEPCFTLDRKM